MQKEGRKERRKRGGDVVQLVELLPSMCKALGSIFITKKKEKKKP